VTTDANAHGQPINIHKNFVTLLPQAAEKLHSHHQKLYRPPSSTRKYSKSKNEMGEKKTRSTKHLPRPLRCI